MRKFVIVVTTLFLAISVCLSGCGQHEHTWVEATCAAPKTCSECGMTEGSALEHGGGVNYGI